LQIFFWLIKLLTFLFFHMNLPTQLGYLCVGLTSSTQGHWYIWILSR
jgi:Kef-type K+ transport system membrane component KefB